MAKTAITTSVVTGKVRFSYVHVFEPSAQEGNEPKYSVSVLIPKEDKKTLGEIKVIIDALKTEFTKKGGKITSTFKTPLRDGDGERPDDEAYAGHYFLNASSKNKPGVVKRSAIKGQVEPVTSEDDFYSGCYGRADINFYLFDKNGNKGIAAGLNNILVTEEGESLAGRRSAAAAFSDLDDEEESFM